MVEFRKYRRHRGWLAACLVSIPLLWIVSGLEHGSAPALALFVGRFHPSLVHFPIGFLLLGGLMEIVAMRFDSLRGVRSAVPFVLATAAAASLSAVLAGYLLSLEGGYQEGSVSTHMWLGFIVALAAVAVFVLERLAHHKRVHANAYRGVLAATAVLVLVTGHLGGSISRGDGYLTYYLPNPVKKLVGLSMREDGLIANIDSAFVYQDMIAPVLERRCVKCHGASRSEEDLRLDAPEHILEGGEGGPVIVTGKPGESDLLRRATLPPYDEDVMPPDGEAPLSIGET
ncbi:MAG: c-type cytochrome domain-containing protein, partial [Rhodothermales bacterium]